jgi:hypothetical protein
MKKLNALASKGNSGKARENEYQKVISHIRINQNAKIRKKEGRQINHMLIDSQQVGAFQIEKVK